MTRRDLRRALAALTVGMLLAVVVVAVGLAAVWPNFFNRPEGAHRPEIAQEVADWAASATPGDQLLLSHLTSFEWDRAVVFNPYVTDEDAERALGFPWHVEATDAAWSDGVNVLAFVRGNHVVAWTELPRNQLELPLELEGDGHVMPWFNAGFFLRDGCSHHCGDFPSN